MAPRPPLYKRPELKPWVDAFAHAASAHLTVYIG